MKKGCADLEKEKLKSFKPKVEFFTLIKMTSSKRAIIGRRNEKNLGGAHIGLLLSSAVTRLSDSSFKVENVIGDHFDCSTYTIDAMIDAEHEPWPISEGRWVIPGVRLTMDEVSRVIKWKALGTAKTVTRDEPLDSENPISMTRVLEAAELLKWNDKSSLLDLQKRLKNVRSRVYRRMMIPELLIQEGRLGSEQAWLEVLQDITRKMKRCANAEDELTNNAHIDYETYLSIQDDPADKDTAAARFVRARIDAYILYKDLRDNQLGVPKADGNPPDAYAHPPSYDTCDGPSHWWDDDGLKHILRKATVNKRLPSSPHRDDY